MTPVEGAGLQLQTELDSEEPDSNLNWPPYPSPIVWQIQYGIWALGEHLMLSEKPYLKLS